jgi:hypothetical protein
MMRVVDGALCADPPSVDGLNGFGDCDDAWGWWMALRLSTLRFVVDGLNGFGACDDVCGGWRSAYPPYVLLLMA